MYKDTCIAATIILLKELSCAIYTFSETSALGCSNGYLYITTVE